MTDEERQRQIEFIINTLARITASEEIAALERRADAVRIARLEESYVIMTRMAERFDERLDEHHERISTVEQAMVILTRLADKNLNGEAP